MIPRAAEVISAANQRSLPVVMVTNPSGIGRGYYGWTEFKCVRTRLSFRSSRRARESMRFALRAPSRCGRLVGSSGSSGTQAQSRYASAGSVRFRSRSERVMAGQRQGKRQRSCQRRALPALSRPRPATAKLAAKLASLNFGVRFGRSIANAITLPILMAGERAAQCRS